MHENLGKNKNDLQISNYKNTSKVNKRKSINRHPFSGIKDDTNISEDDEKEEHMRGRVNSMKTHVRDLTGTLSEMNFRDTSMQH